MSILSNGFSKISSFANDTANKTETISLKNSLKVLDDSKKTISAHLEQTSHDIKKAVSKEKQLELAQHVKAITAKVTDTSKTAIRGSGKVTGKVASTAKFLSLIGKEFQAGLKEGWQS